MGSELVERFAAVRQAMDTCRSHAGQAVLSTFIREGHFTRHIRRMRKIYEERRRILVEEIEQQFGSLCRITGAAAGMHLTVLFDDQLNDREIAAKALRDKLLLSALSLSYFERSPRHGFVLGFGNTPVRQIPGAVSLLKRMVSSSTLTRNSPGSAAPDTTL